jgi:hypothetical protein
LNCETTVTSFEYCKAFQKLCDKQDLNAISSFYFLSSSFSKFIWECFLSYLQLLRNRQLKFCASRKLFLCFAQLSPSTAFPSSISGLSTKSDTSTLNDIIYYSFPLSKIEQVDFSFFIFYTG